MCFQPDRFTSEGARVSGNPSVAGCNLNYREKILFVKFNEKIADANKYFRIFSRNVHSLRILIVTKRIVLQVSEVSYYVKLNCLHSSIAVSHVHWTV